MPSPPLSTIYNFLAYEDGTGTSGQPTTAQFGAIQEAGYAVVINLATGTTPRDLPHEAQVVSGLGMAYIHIPVIWDAPTMANLTQFFDTMDATQDTQRFVHCIANMRVSAFMCLYRVLRHGIPEQDARAMMHRIWEPNAIWKPFVDTALAQR